MEIREPLIGNSRDQEMIEMESPDSNPSTCSNPFALPPSQSNASTPFLTSSSSHSHPFPSNSSNIASSLNPFPSLLLSSASPQRPSHPKLSSNQLGKRPLPSTSTSRITLHPIRSALLLTSTAPPHLPQVPKKFALYDEPPPIGGGGEVGGVQQEENEGFLLNSGRSLRVRGKRPSYLEIPPSAHPLVEGTKEKEKVSLKGGKGKEKDKDKEKEKVGGFEGKNRKKRKRLNNGNGDSNGGGGESELSELTSSEEEQTVQVEQKRKRKKKKKIVKVSYEPEGYDRDSSPLSSLKSFQSSSSLSSDSGSDSEEPSSSSLAFPNKPSSHPLNRIKLHPKPSIPPSLEMFKGLNEWSWEEGLRGLMLNQEIVEPTFEDDVEEEGERMEVDEGEGRKKPTWEWAIEREVSPVPPPPVSTSIAHPPPTPSKTTTFLSIPPPLTQLVPLTTTTTAIVRPKTYRQLARLDWEDFHYRNKCRFTTSGSIEGVNPEGLAWEDWFGLEDEGCLSLRREGMIEPSRKRKGKGGLVVLDEGGLRAIGGEGEQGEFEKLRWEQSFESGMEWSNVWRWKTLEEGMGNSLEWKCRWAVRNPARVWEEVKVTEEEREMVMTRERERSRLKREKKKLKRERMRKEREGSGGESELTPLEGEELSADSSDEEREKAKSESAEDIATRSSLILQEAAEAHAASGKAGVMVKCPLVGCPQQFYRSKASSSISTHERHYHTSHINLKYATGKSAYIQRDPKGDFICPATGCGFVTKSRGTMAVHGKPGKCEGPAVSIPKPSRRKKGKRYKLPPPQAVAAPTVVAEEGKEPAPLPNYFGAATKSSRFLSSEFVSSSEDELEGGPLVGVEEE